MGRSTSENIIYPSVGVSRDIYHTYMMDSNRPKPALLLELAMCAYMNVESSKEVTMQTLLETKRNLTSVFAEQEVAKKAAADEIKRAEIAEKEAKRRKEKMIINECFIACGVKTPPFREPKNTQEIRYNERLCDTVRDRMFERYQLQPGNYPDDVIIDYWFEIKGDGGSNNE